MALEKKFDPPDLLFPLPLYLQRHFNTVSNFGLYFQKFCRYQKEGVKLKCQHSWNNGQRGRDRMDYEWLLLENQLSHAVVLKNAQPLLAKLHERQNRCLESYSELGSGILEISATAQTPLLTGIGETSPTEVGMLFDRNMGIPYLPASSIKGAVRYGYCVNFANNNPDKAVDGILEEKSVDGLTELFGATDTKDSSRGGFAFMDAYSEQVPELAVDIMNPHHGKYYQKQNPEGPVETELPVPIKFLVVKKGAVYKFRGFFLTKEAEEYREKLIEAFHTAMELLGLGAKSAVGYGRFDNILDTTKSVEQRANERKEAEKLSQKKDQERRENEQRLEEERASAERKKAASEILQKEQEALKAAEQEALLKAIDESEGIERDILLLRKEPGEDRAIDCYDTYLKKLSLLNEKELELGLLIQPHFKKWNKKTKQNKLVRREHLNKLLRQ